jgi:acyl-CoA hydrolase
MEGKKVSKSVVTMAQIMNPDSANPAVNVHGGDIMKLIDTVGGVAATRHARAYVVTASIDRLDFHNPVFVGNFLTLKASVNYVGNTSMEVGVRVEAENPITGKICHTASAYLSFVALDKEKRPIQMPPLILETAIDKQRNMEAAERKQMRLEEKRKEKSRHETTTCRGA